MEQQKLNKFKRGDKATIKEHVYKELPLGAERIDLFEAEVFIKDTNDEGLVSIQTISGKFQGLIFEVSEEVLSPMEVFDFPKEVDLGTSKAYFIAGVREWNSDYLGWTIYYIPKKEEFVVWVYNDSSGGMNGGAYCSRFITALDNLRMRADVSAKYGLELDYENMNKYVNGKNMI